MKYTRIASVVLIAASISACQSTTATQSDNVDVDACGASQHQGLVGGPSSAVFALDVPDTSRHYGSEERTATNNASRLNFVHSGTVIESLMNPSSTIIRIFCG